MSGLGGMASNELNGRELDGSAGSPIGVQEVVETQFLALELFASVDALALGSGLDVEGGRLMGVLAVTQPLLGDQSETEDDPAKTIELFDVNLTWPAAALAALRPRLIAQGSGHVAVFSSVAGVRVRRSNFSYGSTKAGLDALTLGFGDSLRSEGIKVQSIRPGFVRTKMTDGLSEAPFTTGVDEAADTITKGLASSADVIWSPAKLQAVFLILRHLPSFVWRRMPG